MESDNFTWEEILLMFPDWSNDSEGNKIKVYWSDMEESPKYDNGLIKFLLKEYGFQISLKEKIPIWIKHIKPKTIKEVEDFYLKASQEIFNRVSKEIKKNMPILDGWRSLISKNDGNRWTGHLQDSLYFRNKGNEIELADRFTYRSEGGGDTPTDMLSYLKDIPEVILREDFKELKGLSGKIIYGEETGSNFISGTSITDCIKTADLIYKKAESLKDLKNIF